MEQYLAMLLVVLVAAAFYGVSYLKKKRLFPLCDRFAQCYCELADQMLSGVDCKASLNFQRMDGDLIRVCPPEEQPEAIREIMAKPADDSALSKVRELFFLRDEIQSHASNGSFAKDKYNAITNQLFEALNTYLSIINNPLQLFSQKELDYFHYYLQKQAHIRNVTLPSIVSRNCAASIAV